MIKSEKGKSICLTHVENFSKQGLKKHTCKYFRKKHEKFSLTQLGPKGLCLDLYFAAYPYCLALLYGAHFSWEKDALAVSAQCPAPEGNVHFEVRKEPLTQQILSNGIKKNCKIVITVTAVEPSKKRFRNGCVCRHKKGEKFEFNQGDDLTQMCPAAFYTLYPNLKVMLNGGKASWIKEKKVYMQCPDNISGIMFKLE